MIEDVISGNREKLERICERHGVSSLAMFGSATGGDFGSEESDLDFAVEFKPMTPVEHKNAYFGMLSDLEALFGRSVDLVELDVLENPYIRENIRAQQKTVYAAA